MALWKSPKKGHNQAPMTWPSAEAHAESPSIDHYRGLSSEGLSVRARADGEDRKHTKKLSSGGRGVSGRRSEDFITDRKHEKKKGMSVGGRGGVSGRRSEDFITEREYTKIN